MDSNQTNDGDRHPAGVGSSEYRARLLTKLNCLMAVLEVAITKIGRSMEDPSANLERLTKIRSNLENTLSICSRAKDTLERTMSRSSSRPVQRSTDAQARPSMSYRDYVELSSIEEYRKFKSLPPIDADDLATADIDDILRKLYES